MGKTFREARVKAGLPEELVLYCGRRDYVTRILTRTGNLAAVMKTMGHRDVKTAISTNILNLRSRARRLIRTQQQGIVCSRERYGTPKTSIS